MSGLYLHLSKGHDNVERTAEASQRPATHTTTDFILSTPAHRPSGGVSIACTGTGQVRGGNTPAGRERPKSEYTKAMRRAVALRTAIIRSRLTRGLAALALAATVAACDDAGPTVPTDSTDDVPLITETFSGALTPNSAVTFPFTVYNAGTATGSVVSITPDSTIPLGIAMGTWTGSTCQLVISNDNALPFGQVVGTVGGPGLLCLRVYDTGRVTAMTTFTVKVVHP